MNYNPIKKCLEIPVENAQEVYFLLLYALKHIRIVAGLTLDKYEKDGALENVDHAQKAVIDLAISLGIDLGVKWGNELDLRNVSD